MIASSRLLAADLPTGYVRSLVVRHPLASFFSLAFAWSWTVAWLQPLLPGGAGPLFQFGPPIAAMVVWSATGPGVDRACGQRRWTVFGVAAAIAFLIWVTFFSLVLVADHTLAFFANGAVVAALAALLVSTRPTGRRPVRALLTPSSMWWATPRWYAMAGSLLPATFVLGIALATAVGDRIPSYPNGGPSGMWLLAFAWIVLFGGGMEELGWRSFALPRLQSRHSPLVASLVLSCVWAAWHIPEYLNGFYAGAAAGSSVASAILMRFLLFTPPLAILMTWAFNGAAGKLGVVVFMHAAYNAASMFLPLTSTAYALAFGVQWLAALAVAVGARMWRRSPAERG